MVCALHYYYFHFLFLAWDNEYTNNKAVQPWLKCDVFLLKVWLDLTTVKDISNIRSFWLMISLHLFQTQAWQQNVKTLVNKCIHMFFCSSLR